MQGSCRSPPCSEVYSGEFVGGLEHGAGVLTTATGTYKGEFASGQKNGCGIEVSKSGQRFLGTFFNDNRHGLALIQTRGQRKGQVLFEKWDMGVRMGEGAEVSRDYVGGAIEAAAELAAAAFSSVAMTADRKALLAEQCSRPDENAPPPPEQHAKWEDTLRAPAQGSKTVGASAAGSNDGGKEGGGYGLRRLSESKRVLEEVVNNTQREQLQKKLDEVRSENARLKDVAEKHKEEARLANLARAAAGKELALVQVLNPETRTSLFWG